MAILEGAWDCAQCLRKGIPGLMKDCPECGSPHDSSLDPSEEYYLPENARVITDPEELKAADAGPNWNCGSCGMANAGNLTYCRGCEKPRDSDDVVEQVVSYVDGVDAVGKDLSTSEDLENDRVNATLQWADKLQALEDGPVTLPSRTLAGRLLPRKGKSPYGDEERPQDVIRSSGGSKLAVMKRVTALPPRTVKLAAIGMSVMLVAVLAILGGNWFYANYVKTQTVDLTVSSLSWERSIEIEAFRTLTQSDWTVPADGRVIGSRREIRSYQQVIDHYDTKYRQVGVRTRTGSHPERYVCGSTRVSRGNGTYESKDTYCYRTVDDYTTVYHPESYQVPVYRSEPVYDTKYTYQVDRWVTDHYDRASGSTNPHWPSPTVNGPKQRQGTRSETYSAVLVDAKNRQSSHKMDETAWSHLSKGQVVRGEQTHSGSVRKVYWP